MKTYVEMIIYDIKKKARVVRPQKDIVQLSSSIKSDKRDCTHGIIVLCYPAILLSDFFFYFLLSLFCPII